MQTCARLLAIWPSPTVLATRTLERCFATRAASVLARASHADDENRACEIEESGGKTVRDDAGNTADEPAATIVAPGKLSNQNE